MVLLELGVQNTVMTFCSNIRVRVAYIFGMFEENPE